jgi:hypothetical protein
MLHERRLHLACRARETVRLASLRQPLDVHARKDFELFITARKHFVELFVVELFGVFGFLVFFFEMGGLTC